MADKVTYNYFSISQSKACKDIHQTVDTEQTIASPKPSHSIQQNATSLQSRAKSKTDSYYSAFIAVRNSTV